MLSFVYLLTLLKINNIIVKTKTKLNNRKSFFDLVLMLVHTVVNEKHC